MKKHFGDPCIHCGIPHDEIASGDCTGDFKKAIPIAFASLGVRWDHVEHHRVRFSDGRIEDRWNHISENAPYFHFGHSDVLISPPRYDESLKKRAP